MNMQLDKYQRLVLTNQFRILQLLDDIARGKPKTENYNEDYESLAAISEMGYTAHYDDILNLPEPLSTEESDEVNDILSMHQALAEGVEDLAKHKTAEEIEALAEQTKFLGFDANKEQESRYLRYAGFIKKHRSLYNGVHVFNGHMPTLGRYRKMVNSWKSFRGGHHFLTEGEIKSILEAGTYVQI